MLTGGAVPADCFSLPRDASRAFALLQTHEGRRELSFALRKPLGDVDWESFNRQVGAIQRGGIGVVTCSDGGYPAFLRDIPESPAVLFCRGDRARLGRRGVAIVGSRRASARGVSFTRSLAGEIASLGIPVVSGAARGIDTAAHRGALDRGGTTVAVLGTGLDVPYPPGNVGLLDEIAASGCVISEQLMGTPPLKHVFPRRNRLISALSHVVVVCEAGERSGALITARWALEQGRDVGAVPGFPGDAHCRGSNRLIKGGAFAVEGVADILEAVPVLGPKAIPGATAQLDDTARNGRPPVRGWAGDRSVPPDLPEGARAVLEALGSGPVDIDTLARHVGLDAPCLQALLLELELRGFVERDLSDAYHTRWRGG
jgi:DNA processing protein